MVLTTLWVLCVALAQEPLPTDSRLSALPASPDPRVTLQAAAWALVDGPSIELAGVQIDAVDLATWAATPPGLDVQTAVRESTRRPVDLADLLLLLDDIVATRRTDPVILPVGRARSEGLLVHPTDVFRGRSRRYGGDRLDTDRPAPQRWVTPADDGDPLGVRWTTRYANPPTTQGRLAALIAERPESDFAARIALLLAQLEAQGALVAVTSTARDPRRGYLLWGSFLVSRQTSERGVDRAIDRLERARRDWDLDVPIVWHHPDGWQATVRAATEMAETYDVVYATEYGARSSDHYGGLAVDMVALGLPALVTLTAPDGQTASFDLSAPGHSRDLSLEPELVSWIETHYALRKLNSDYPHWGDETP